MTTTLLEAAVTLLVAFLPPPAGMQTVRITIQGGSLLAPIEITDPQAFEPFHVGAGPGNFTARAGGPRVPSYPAQCFIVDWGRGIAEPPKALPVYDVVFHTNRGAYVVRYALDPATNRGYVYIPGADNPPYKDNVSIILRGVEGNWFHAWSAWEKLVHPLIAKAAKAK